MSAALIERELEEYLAHSDYEVTFRQASGYHWFTVYVIYRADVIASKPVCKSYPRAAWWAKRQVRGHAKALKMLGGLVKQTEPSCVHSL